MGFIGVTGVGCVRKQAFGQGFQRLPRIRASGAMFKNIFIIPGTTCGETCDQSDEQQRSKCLCGHKYIPLKKCLHFKV